MGKTVALAGGIAIVGAYGGDDKGDNSGAALAFEQQRDGQWRQTFRFAAPDGAPDDRFGKAVAIDGTTAVIGAYRAGAGHGPGAAYVFERQADGTWASTFKFDPRGRAQDAQLGTSVAISGSTVLLGADRDDARFGDCGAAYIFVRTGPAPAPAPIRPILSRPGTASQSLLPAGDSLPGSDGQCHYYLDEIFDKVSALDASCPGAPTTCTPECGAVVLPFLDECGSVINALGPFDAADGTRDGTAGVFATLRSTCSAIPAGDLLGELRARWLAGSCPEQSEWGAVTSGAAEAAPCEDVRSNCRLLAAGCATDLCPTCSLAGQCDATCGFCTDSGRHRRVQERSSGPCPVATLAAEANAVNAACCDPSAGGCTGVPSHCDAKCGVVYPDFFSRCSALLPSQDRVAYSRLAQSCNTQPAEPLLKLIGRCGLAAGAGSTGGDAAGSLGDAAAPAPPSTDCGNGVVETPEACDLGATPVTVDLGLGGNAAPGSLCIDECQMVGGHYGADVRRPTLSLIRHSLSTPD